MRYIYNESKVIKFEVGKTYVTRYIGDSNLKLSYKILSRTDKSVLVEDVKTHESKRCKISIYSGVEQCLPDGNYSKAPVLSADKLA